jgi:hypothetical protein
VTEHLVNAGQQPAGVQGEIAALGEVAAGPALGKLDLGDQRGGEVDFLAKRDLSAAARARRNSPARRSSVVGCPTDNSSQLGPGRVHTGSARIDPSEASAAFIKL